MKTNLRYAVACAVVSALSVFPVLAAEGGAKPSPKDRKAACTHEARGLEGAERADFIAWCLKQEVAPARQAKAPAPGSQQDKMRRCNVEAKQKALRGDERRAFMSSCLRA